MAEDFGKLVLRLGVGGTMLFHGVHKLLTGLDPVKSLLAAHKLPDALAYIVYFGEIVGPLLIILIGPSVAGIAKTLGNMSGHH